MKIDGEDLMGYIRELDLVFSRMLGRFRVLFSKYNEDLITETQFVVLRCLRNRGPPILRTWPRPWGLL